MKVQAVVFPARDQIEIRDVELAEVQKNQIRTETIYSFVSPGSELRTLAGHYGAAKISRSFRDIRPFPGSWKSDRKCGNTRSAT